VSAHASASLLSGEIERLRAHYGHFIDGCEVAAASGESFRVVSPIDQRIVSRVANGGAEDVALAVSVAAESFASGAWSKRSGHARAAVLRGIAAGLAEAADELAAIETLSIGRPVREMRAQLRRFAEWFDYFGALAETMEGSVPPFEGGHLNYVTRHPIGVAGIITPWNHPLAIAIKKLAPALAAGNCAVIKPSEYAPVTPIELAHICHRAGLPPGTLNVVNGQGPVAGRALAAHPSLGRIDFTGGTETGRAVAATAGQNLVPVTAELGGKGPVIVFDDVDTQTALAATSFAGFIASGQTCVQGSRVLVQAPLYESVVTALANRAGELRVGNPLDAATQFGPLASERQLERVSAAVDRAREQGASVVCGGKRLREPPLDRGWYYAPTVLSNVTPDMDCFRDEIFGPVLVTVPFEDEADAVRLANDSLFGLGASVWTSAIARAHRVADRLEAGVVWINTHHRTDPASPWGGVKNSGIGREQGQQAYQMYTETKSVIVNTDDSLLDWYAGGTNERLN
jgi:acyl-CoA reductase-like NAD-dependent aldehyde dehydrogenase